MRYCLQVEANEGQHMFRESWISNTAPTDSEEVKQADIVPKVLTNRGEN